MPDFTSFDDAGLDRIIASQSGAEPLCQAAIGERQRRQLQRAEQQAQKRQEESERLSAQRHEQVMLEQQRLRGTVDTVSTGQSALKHTVDRIHRIDVWILIAGAIAALAGVILLVLEFVRGFGAGG
jgi:Flp pilus assembly protein TadB